MDEVREKFLSSAFGLALFEKWPELSFALEQDRMLYRALELASLGIGRTHPNPPVGSVVAKNGVVVAEGFHERAGLPHAEANALRCAGEQARGADLYVSLEPCAHHGRTPPCCEAVISSGVRRAFVGALDPNPHVAGGGLAAVKAAGVDAEIVDNRFLQALSKEIIKPFVTSKTRNRPYVVMTRGDGDNAVLDRLKSKVDAVANSEQDMAVENALAFWRNQGFTSVLLQGSAVRLTQFLDAGVVDEVWSFEGSRSDQVRITRIQSTI